MAESFGAVQAAAARPVWAVGPLMRAIADSLSARFNPVTVRGELSGFSRAASGHCYFTLKDDAGQLRCALFRRSAEQLNFAPRDGMVAAHAACGLADEADVQIQRNSTHMGLIADPGIIRQVAEIIVA